MLVLGILMAIAIPLIGGVREAANNTKCRSNLKQLHTAIFAFATGNKERFPSALEDLVVKGYINEQTKLGNCPGSGNKQPGLVPSDYELGADLFDAGNPKTLSSADINSNTIILADANTENHKAGRNAIRLDGSFRQNRAETTVVETPDEPAPVLGDLHAQFLKVQDIAGVTKFKFGSSAHDTAATPGVTAQGVSQHGDNYFPTLTHLNTKIAAGKTIILELHFDGVYQGQWKFLDGQWVNSALDFPLLSYVWDAATSTWVATVRKVRVEDGQWVEDR